MAHLIQIGSVVVCGFLFEQVMKVMGQKELGNIIRIVSWVMFVCAILTALGDLGLWMIEKAKAINAFFEPFRSFIEKF